MQDCYRAYPVFTPVTVCGDMTGRARAHSLQDVEGLRDLDEDPVVAATAYGGPDDEFLRVVETYYAVPYSNGLTLTKRVTYSRPESPHGIRIELETW